MREKMTRMTTGTSDGECLFCDVLTGLKLYNLMPYCPQRFYATSDSARHSHAVLFILSLCRLLRRVAYEDYKMRKTREKMTRMTIGTGAGECVFLGCFGVVDPG